MINIFKENYLTILFCLVSVLDKKQTLNKILTKVEKSIDKTKFCVITFTLI